MKMLKTLARATTCLGLAAGFALGPALPGRAAQVILSDPLTSWPLNFGPQTDHVMMKDGQVHIIVSGGSAGWEIYPGFSFKDMDASVTVTAKTATGNDAGLLFWVTAPTDFYVFSVSDSAGTLGVVHHVATNGGAWQTIVPFTKDPNIHSGKGAVNALRVVTSGNSISLYINGTSVGRLAAIAPENGGTVGIEGEGKPDGKADYAFSDLSVSE
jgi:hypothetical protein